jgi:hypothetical protein
MSQSEKMTSYGRFAILLIVIGVLLGIDAFWNLSFIYKLWPLIITMLGIGFIGIFKTRDRKEALYLSVGIYLLGFSFLALWCDFTTWYALKALWPLFITFLGLSFLFAHIYGGKKRAWLLIGLLLISLSAVLYFVFTVNPALWWSVFVLAGASVLISERAR